jgi:ABC-type multidrug transport system fused ATPase/permease subunit
MSSEGFVHRSYSTQISDYTRLLFLIEIFKNGIRFVPAIIALLVGIVVLAPGRAATLVLEASVVFAATTILIRLFLSLGALMTAGGALLIDGRAAKDLGLLVDIHRAPHVPRTVPGRGDGPALERVELCGVHYAYDRVRAVLDDLCLNLQRGNCYSLVGSSGTGKSTLADLLLGLVVPNRGRILMNGREIDGGRLRGRVILVEQQPRIFSVSVRENLTLGLDVTDTDVKAALEAVELKTFVESLPDGLDTQLDYQGSNLSGGQRQRLSIARALLRRPEVLILDEATSALDARTEKLVIQSLKRAMHDGILIFITHDPEVAAVADETIDLQHRRPEPATTA